MDILSKETRKELYSSICHIQIIKDYLEFVKSTEKIISYDEYLIYFEEGLKRFKDK